MFDLGNIITIVICLGFITLFRYTDKNNRSLEKLRKFGDRQKDDFVEFVDSKMKSFENISVDIGVTLDRAGAALDALREEHEKLVAEEEQLGARREEIAEAVKKISMVDQTVAGLAEAAASADKHLEKVAEVSKFADFMTQKVQEARDGLEAVSSRIEGLEQQFADFITQKVQEARDSLEAVSSKIDGLEEHFLEKNAAALSSVREDVMAGLKDSIDEIDAKIQKAMHDAEEVEVRAQENLQRIYDNLLSKAADRAESLEGQMFEKLKFQAEERLEQYKDATDASANNLLEQTKESLAESQQLVKNFKAEWKISADSMMQKAQSELEALAARTREEYEKMKGEHEESLKERSAEQIAFFQKLKADTDNVAETSAKIIESASKQLQDVEGKLEGFNKEADGQFARLRGLLNELPLIDSRIQASIADIEEKSSAALELFTQEQNTRRDRFEAAFNVRSESLMGKLQNLESSIAELKNHAYANISEKVKIFENDFFGDLKARADAMNAEMNSWQTTLEQRLSAISEESEAIRANAEAKYTEELKARLANLEEGLREHSAKAEAHLREVEKTMRDKLDENSAEVKSFADQYREDFQKAKESAEAFARREIQVHSANIQETLRVKQLEIESRYKEFINALNTEKDSAESIINRMREIISDWQRKNEKAVEAASHEIEAKISDFRESSAAIIANVEANAQSEFSAAVTRIGTDTESLRISVDELREKIASAGEDLDKRSEAALDNFSKLFDELSKRIESQTREAKEQSENTTLSLKAQGAEISASLEETRQKLFKKIQNDIDTLSEALEEISEKQKDFVENTRIFSRADELRSSLENSVEKLKIEVGNLSVYEEEMTRLKSQYQQIREMSNDADEKVSTILNEKKRIDSIESSFNILLDASAKTTEKVSEMTRTRDEVLDYQARLRRFEESIEKMNERYDRVERKSLTIDQTLASADKAFESIKELEKSLKEFRERSASMPVDLDAIQSKMNVLLNSAERVGEIESKITQLESELSDTEKRTKRIQDDRKAFVNMEKRLINLKTEADKAIGLFRTLSKPDVRSFRKDDGAPSFERRAYVKELKHKNWTIDEIAQSMKLSKAEVELILDEPD